jgi:hypothetical protein
MIIYVKRGLTVFHMARPCADVERGRPSRSGRKAPKEVVAVPHEALRSAIALGLFTPCRICVGVAPAVQGSSQEPGVVELG